MPCDSGISALLADRTPKLVGGQLRFRLRLRQSSEDTSVTVQHLRTTCIQSFERADWNAAQPDLRCRPVILFPGLTPEPDSPRNRSFSPAFFIDCVLPPSCCRLLERMPCVAFVEGFSPGYYGGRYTRLLKETTLHCGDALISLLVKKAAPRLTPSALAALHTLRVLGTTGFSCTLGPADVGFKPATWTLPVI